MSDTTLKNAFSDCHNLILTCADGLEAPLMTELASFGITDVALLGTGRVAVTVSLAQCYQLCLWTRVASRILLPLGKRNINADYDITDQLYTLGRSVDWTAEFGLEQTFAIRLSVDKRTAVNQQFAMLRIKDAIADTFNDKFDARPNVDSKHPDLSIFATVNDKQAEIFLDLSGTSLHRRGYRVAMTDAPLKENLAAALLYTVGWHQHKATNSERGSDIKSSDIKNDAPHDTTGFDCLIDPMCGSGTFLIEAMLMTCDYPVGLDKSESQFGFAHWQHHDSELWEKTVSEATARFHERLQAVVSGEVTLPAIYGFDADANAIKATHKNLIQAGLGELLDKITLQQRPLHQLNTAFSKPLSEGRLTHTLIITNPPYGERLGGSERIDVIKPLYHGLGLRIQDIFSGSTTAPVLGVLAAEVEHADVLPLNDPKTLRCHNGAITVYFRHGEVAHSQSPTLIERFEKTPVSVDEGQDFVNRLQKNLAHLRKMATNEGVTNLRVYDADLPDFKVAVDVYGDFVHVQEYAPPKKIPAPVAKKRFNLALAGIRDVLGVNREQVFIKTRAKQSGNEQYSKAQEGKKAGKKYVVLEDGAYFYVNFTDYLDTGLFIDHRNMRGLIKSASRNKRVLNLFAYTCTASVHAALAGAKSVTSVDLSQNYLDWGEQNFALNGLDVTNHTYEFVAADVFEWIKNNTEQFEVIFIDPPTFSNSKKFQGTFDVQRDHPALINRAMNRLTSDGVLYFSNNFTKFELDESLKERYDITEITHQTIGFDFDIKKPIHRSFAMRHRSV